MRFNVESRQRALLYCKYGLSSWTFALRSLCSWLAVWRCNNLYYSGTHVRFCISPSQLWTLLKNQIIVAHPRIQHVFLWASQLIHLGSSIFELTSLNKYDHSFCFWGYSSQWCIFLPIYEQQNHGNNTAILDLTNYLLHIISDSCCFSYLPEAIIFS